MKGRSYLTVLKNTVQGWSDDNATLFAAALSYYTFFSMAPLLLIAISIAGIVFGKAAADQEIALRLQALMGKDSARMVQNLVLSVHKPSTNIIATLIGSGALMAGASSVFYQLQSALNMIWKTQQTAKYTLWRFVMQQLLSFGMVLVTGFMLLVSLFASTAVYAISRFAGITKPGHIILWKAADLAISFIIITVLFALIFKVLPAASIRARPLWIGAAVTSMLFTVGKYVIGIYLGIKGIASAYGAAASLAVILLWIYYSANILFFGAEFTKAYAEQSKY